MTGSSIGAHKIRFFYDLVFRWMRTDVRSRQLSLRWPQRSVRTRWNVSSCCCFVFFFSRTAVVSFFVCFPLCRFRAPSCRCRLFLAAVSTGCPLCFPFELITFFFSLVRLLAIVDFPSVSIFYFVGTRLTYLLHLCFMPNLSLIDFLVWFDSYRFRLIALIEHQWLRLRRVLFLDWNRDFLLRRLRVYYRAVVEIRVPEWAASTGRPFCCPFFRLPFLFFFFFFFKWNQRDPFFLVDFLLIRSVCVRASVRPCVRMK